MKTLFILAFVSGQMIALPGLTEEECQQNRDLLLRNGFAGFGEVAVGLGPKAQELAENMEEYVIEAVEALLVECLSETESAALPR